MHNFYQSKQRLFLRFSLERARNKLIVSNINHIYVLLFRGLVFDLKTTVHCLMGLRRYCIKLLISQVQYKRGFTNQGGQTA